MNVTWSKEYFFLFLISAAILIVGFLFISDDRLEKRIVDEKVHVTQTQRLYKGRTEPVQRLTNIPGYHYATAGILTVIEPILGFPQVTSFHVRAVAILYTILLLLTVFALLKQIGEPIRKIFLVLLLPILSPYLFLAYTETLSLILILLATLCHMRKYHLFSALVLLLAILVRQDNIIWVGLFLLWSMISHINYPRTLTNLRSFFLHNLPYFALLCGFALFTLVNSGVAIGDRDAHTVGIDFNNVYFFLVLFPVLFLPMIINSLPSIYHTLKRRLLPISIFSILFGALSISDFQLNHSYNINPLFLHNKILHFFSDSTVGIPLGIILSVLTILFLCVKAYESKKYTYQLLTLYVISAISLALHPLVEHRYAVIPAVLFILFAQQKNKVIYYLQLTYFALITSFLYWAIFAERIFKL